MPIVDGKTLIAWGVVRAEPRDFVGLFETQREAAAKAIAMGQGYAARYGETTTGDDFVWKMPVPKGPSAAAPPSVLPIPSAKR